MSSELPPTLPQSAPRGPMGPELPPRYRVTGVLDAGGMGTVWRAIDERLDRPVAVKVVDGGQGASEALHTARLDHPAVVPVYDRGQLADGRSWYAMRELRGAALAQVADRVRRASSPSGWGAAADGWTLSRVVGAMETACRAVAWAHERGVVHRDLKPANLFVGRFGEVQVGDWGLAARVGAPAPEGFVGAPAYAAPAQRPGSGEPVGPAQDVWALGGCLYRLLCGIPPFPGAPSEVIAQLGSAEVPSLMGRAEGGPPPPEELRGAVEHAMAADPEERGSAEALADRLRAWLDGVRRRARARELVGRGQAARRRARALAEEGEEASARARRILAATRPWEGERAKAAGWDLEDRARQLRAEAVQAGARAEGELQAALRLAPLPEAHGALADLYRARAVAADRARDPAGEALALQQLARHDRQGRHASFLAGTGALTLVTEPPGAEVLLERYDRRRRRLVPVPAGHLGRTPLVQVDLPRGSYRLRLRLAGHHEVLYPVMGGRGEHWHGVPPGGSAPQPVRLLPQGALGPDEVYVPAGWCVLGDPDAIDGLPRQRAWVGAFVMGQVPVTVGQWLEWLDTLWSGGAEDEAMRRVPTLDAEGDAGRVVWRQGGRFVSADQVLEAPWHRDHPVTMVSWHDATAYAAAQGGRLPTEREWEKAARGVDGRIYPFGDAIDPSWANIAGSTDGRPSLVGVRDTPRDRSPYGVLQLAGNARDWCADAYGEGPKAGQLRLSRGGAWVAAPLFCRSANRFADPTTRRLFGLGLRWVRSIAPSS